ncbi:MAG: ABC transporter ATP-binding protein [Saprospiraceae bacterium]|jgi:NitT/TauT family transport system ATP-binding protein|nr:ABC transporter ATP-binding protein [Candidatus Defluviibacterium haderslevense]MCC7028294.1 ABC transporter ATP-binding protein [Saprospiraceae bacterium]MCI1266172.1 ABC transporter ATP-binding protein [Saprospiraceae bacterium]
MSLFSKSDLPKIIELRNINQTYDGGKTMTIKDFNLVIVDKPAQGQFISLLGMSGCGKSTILRYIAGLQQPTSGEVFVHGKLRTDQDHVGMVFQQYSSFPWMTVIDNVAIGLQYKGLSEKIRNEKAMEMIELVGLAGHEKKFAQYPNLSGGQLQRIAIARSLLTNPEILLMDEPFGALDIKTRLQMQELLLALWNKFHSTIVFVTHDINEAVYLSDEIYILKSQPSNIAHKMVVDLPLIRNRELKRSDKYISLVQELEDRMLHISETKLS